MNKKILISIILGVVIIAIFGVYFYQTSAIKISSRNSVSYSGKMMPDFRDSNISSIFISSAENRTNEVEILLNQAKEKDLSEYNFLHRQFLENMIDLVEKRFEESKDRLNQAKEDFEKGNYQEAGENAYLASNNLATLPRHLNNILEGREKEDWNRETSEENNNPDGSYPADYVPPETNYSPTTEEEAPLR